MIGSPPLTRGILEADQQRTVQFRFTPAHAGNTGLSPRFLILKRVHPRSRGEYADTRSVSNFCPGSPPLTRGIPYIVFNTTYNPRFTPAHAGNTMGTFGYIAMFKVHPRSRGEYFFFIIYKLQAPGSPPLTRGIHSYPSLFFAAKRFTPAHAGNTMVWSVVKNGYRGSPPLTRGIPNNKWQVIQCRRFTPAHAGNTL